jgi:hypothetical protein
MALSCHLDLEYWGAKQLALCPNDSGSGDQRGAKRMLRVTNGHKMWCYKTRIAHSANFYSATLQATILRSPYCTYMYIRIFNSLLFPCPAHYVRALFSSAIFECFQHKFWDKLLLHFSAEVSRRFGGRYRLYVHCRRVRSSLLATCFTLVYFLAYSSILMKEAPCPSETPFELNGLHGIVFQKKSEFHLLPWRRTILSFTCFHHAVLIWVSLAFMTPY